MNAGIVQSGVDFDQPLCDKPKHHGKGMMHGMMGMFNKGMGMPGNDMPNFDHKKHGDLSNHSGKVSNHDEHLHKDIQQILDVLEDLTDKMADRPEKKAAAPKYELFNQHW